MKSIRLFAAFVLLACAAGLQAQTLTTFGNTATNGGSWTYTPATSTISGTEGPGDLIFGTPLTSSIGANRYLQLTGNATTAPAGSFTITLEDNASHFASVHYAWTDFTGGATLAHPIEFTTFNFTNITAWSLDSGSSLQAVNASFSQMMAVAVPEPSLYAVCAAGFLVMWIIRREVRKRGLIPVRQTVVAS
jgi:hypothetical protein